MSDVGRQLCARLTVVLGTLDEEQGQDMVEYALLTALISIFAIAILFLIGPYLRDTFQDVINALNSA